MLTVQEIQAMSFEKAVFGGYDMKSVDEFVEQFTEDYAALQKENAALKSKMKVLVDKIEEYRSVEDGMRKALVSAQNIAKETVDDAKKEASQLLEASRKRIEEQAAQCKQLVEEEHVKLETARTQSADFISKMTGMYEAQIQSLIALSTGVALQTEIAEAASAAIPEQELTADASEPTQKFETVSDKAETTAEYHLPADIEAFMKKYEPAEDTLATATPEIHEPETTEAKPDIQPEASPTSEPEREQEGMQIKVMEVTLGKDKNEKSEEKPKFQFGDLKFGAEYSTENEERRR